ncbi:MAG TPA: Ig-like domain repeat protein, partial [Candidatus Acetothermia bacterium]|nr:Ig-like domain repeat protein [Candidatus Acetothermia bacterium]
MKKMKTTEEYKVGSSMYSSLLRRHRGCALVLALLACVSIGMLGFATPTATTIDSNSPNPSVYGQTVTFTATVTGVQTQSGTVTLKEGATTLGGPTALPG